MDTQEILSVLRAERSRIDQAIAAIESLNHAGRRGRVASKKGGRRRMSAAGRKRLSQLLKQRWAQGKMKGRKKAAA